MVEMGPERLIYKIREVLELDEGVSVWIGVQELKQELDRLKIDGEVNALLEEKLEEADAQLRDALSYVEAMKYVVDAQHRLIHRLERILDDNGVFPTQESESL